MDLATVAFLLNVATLIGGLAFGYGRSKAIIDTIHSRVNALETKLGDTPAEAKALKEQHIELAKRTERLDAKLDAYIMGQKQPSHV